MLPNLCALLPSLSRQSTPPSRSGHGGVPALVIALGAADPLAGLLAVVGGGPVGRDGVSNVEGVAAPGPSTDGGGMAVPAAAHFPSRQP